MAWFELIQTMITIFKDIVLAVAAIFGTCIAYKGLGTWQRQLKGQTEYDLARRILIALYKYIDTIDGVRNPFMWENETSLSEEEIKNIIGTDELRFRQMSKAYQARWDKVSIERLSLYPNLLEAKVLWGKELDSLFEEIFILQNELRGVIEIYLESKEPKNKNNQGIKDEFNAKKYIMYATFSESDEYKKNMMDKVEKIEQYLKPKLKRI